MQERSEATCHMAMPQCCYLAKEAKRPSHTTNTIKFDRFPFDPCNSIKRFDLCPFDQKNSTYLQPPGNGDISQRLRGIRSNEICNFVPLLGLIIPTVADKNFSHYPQQSFSLIVVIDLLNSFRDGNDLNLRQLDNISDAVLLVCRCTWAERSITTR